MNAVDTNILIYAHDPRDERKRAIAGSLISNLDEGVLLWQVACEYVSVARKLKRFGFDADAASRRMKVLSSVWQVALPTWATYERAVELTGKSGVSWWDGLIIAACLEAGVTRLYSEDLTNGYRIQRLTVLNPFA